MTDPIRQTIINQNKMLRSWAEVNDLGHLPRRELRTEFERQYCKQNGMTKLTVEDIIEKNRFPKAMTQAEFDRAIKMLVDQPDNMEAAWQGFTLLHQVGEKEHALDLAEAIHQAEDTIRERSC